MTRLAFLLFSFFPLVALSQDGVHVEPFPSWPAVVEYSTITPDTTHSGGYYYLLIERQFNLQVKESCYRNAIKVLTEKGLETASSITVNFNPAFQKLVFHSVLVKRGKETINKLKNNNFEVLRREQNMDRLVYDKSLDAILNLDDIKIGDIVEYSYSIRGVNPVFANNFFRVLYFNYSDPVARLYTRIVCDKNRKLQFKSFNGAPNPDRVEKGNASFYTWDVKGAPALLSEDKIPSWYDGYANVEVTDFESWEDVSQWALPLYSTKSVSSSAITKKVEEIKKAYPKLDDQINACIQFVQDEIRYLSFSDGIQGFKPHSPVQVFNQRFGDCKDKSLLLSYMLRKLGVVSYPALVDTEIGKVLDESLPSPTSFDHCITQFLFRDSVYWIDPTYVLQRGSLKLKTIPNYHYALVISDTTRGLTPFDIDSNPSRIKVEEDFAFRIVGGSATLNVKTSYWGQEANSMRNYWKSTSSEEIKKSYTDFYANEYPDIKLDRYVEFNDDESQNTLTTIEHYSIENFWSYDSLKGQYKAEFYARVLSNYLDLPTTKRRAMPFAVSHPIQVDQTITINLPEWWNVKNSRKFISSPAFRYSSVIGYVSKKITLDYSYQSRLDYIDATETKNHFEKIQSALNDLSFQLTYGTERKSSYAFNTPFLILSLLLAPLLFVGLRRVYFFDPRSRNYEMAYDHIEGWLVLPAMGIFLSPLLHFINIGDGEFFNYDNWRRLTDPTYSSYNPSVGILTLFQFTFNLVSLGFSILLVILFARKRTSFPLVICIVLGADLLYLLIETVWLGSLQLPTAFDQSSLVQPIKIILGALVWVPIFVFSDRVKGTFRERLK